jgi:hypothetical protein
MRSARTWTERNQITGLRWANWIGLLGFGGLYKISMSKSIFKGLRNFIDKSCFFPNFKRYVKVKKSPSPTVWYNSLVKSRSNLHQKPRDRNKYTFMFLHLFCYGTDARTYVRAPRGGMPSCYWCQVVLPNCWRLFFHVLPKIDGCAKVANYWSCSNYLP